jgi:formate--tetrahydrofolate ligase
MTVLLKDAFRPNLVQTLEGNPALIHGGPFANIAHGCNSVIATKTALKMSDYVVTEAGFGADLGAEKFFDIKCRKAGLAPDAVVLVATIRALKHQGGVAKDKLNSENIDALAAGCVNLGRHIRNLSNFGVPVVVGINKFVSDTDAEFETIINYCEQFNVEVSVTSHWEHGGDGAIDLAEKVAKLADSGASQFKTLYDDELPLFAKVETIAKTLYHADEVQADQKVRDSLSWYQNNGFGNLPVCIAKTQYSFSTDPLLLGAPDGHSMSIREVRLSAGAEFLVVVCGAIMTMPGLPRSPAADKIKLNKEGLVEGLF